MKKLTISECAKQRLDDTYLVVYAIKNEINIKKGEYIEPSNIYTFVGIDKKGYRKLLNLYHDRPLNNRYWLDCFESLKSRGLNNILFLSVDDNKNLKRCAKISFPEVTFVDSVTDMMPKFFKYSTDRNEKKVAGKLYSLYTQNSLSEYKSHIEEFKRIYNNAIHQKLIDKYLCNVESIYKLSVSIRKLLFKHSANIYLYDRIRLTFNQHKNYINDLDEIYEMLGDVSNYFGFTSFKKREWTLILNDLIQLYPKIDFI